MRIKLLQYNVQDLFLQLAYPVSAAHLQALSEAHWQLVGATDVKLKPLAQLRGLAAVLAEEAPDVVLLCEVGGAESLKNLARLFLHDAYEPLLIPGQAHRGIGNGFLLRRGLPLRAEIRSHRRVPAPFRYPHEQDPAAAAQAETIAAALGLGRPEERTLSRDLAELRLFWPGSDAPALVLLLAHLKSAYDPSQIDPGGATRRAAEVRGLVGVYERLRAELGPAAPIVVAGDLNGDAWRRATAPEFLPLYERTDLEDALEVLGLPPVERITHFSFFLDQVSARQLDYVMLSLPLHERLVPAGTYVHRYRLPGGADPLLFPMSLWERGLLPSDHYPLVCTLDLG